MSYTAPGHLIMAPCQCHWYIMIPASTLTTLCDLSQAWHCPGLVFCVCTALYRALYRSVKRITQRTLCSALVKPVCCISDILSSALLQGLMNDDDLDRLGPDLGVSHRLSLWPLWEYSRIKELDSVLQQAAAANNIKDKSTIMTSLFYKWNGFLLTFVFNESFSDSQWVMPKNL